MTQQPMSNTILQSPNDLYRILIAHKVSDIIAASPNNNTSANGCTVWKSREHYYDGLRCFIEDIGLHYESFLWNSYIVIIHAVLTAGQHGNPTLVHLMANLIEKYEYPLVAEFTILGELILLLLEEYLFSASDNEALVVRFPLQDVASERYDVHLQVADTDQLMRILEFYISIINSLVVKNRNLPNHFRDFVRYFSTKLCQLLNELQLSLSCMLPLLSILVHTMQKFDIFLILDGIVSWIESQSLLMKCETTSSNRVDGIWHYIRILMMEVVAVANGDFSFAGFGERLSAVIDFCILRTQQNAGGRDDVELKQYLLFTLSGTVSVLSIIYPFEKCHYLNLSQIIKWSFYSKPSIWCLRIFSQMLLSENTDHVQKELSHHFGLDVETDQQPVFERLNVTDCSNKRIKVAETVFPRRHSQEFSSQSLLLLYLFKECDAHRNDKSYVFEERYCLKMSLVLIACSILGIPPTIFPFPRHHLINPSHMLDAYASILLVTTDKATTPSSVQWINLLYELFSPSCTALSEIPANNIALNFDPLSISPVSSSWFDYKRFVWHYSKSNLIGLHQFLLSTCGTRLQPYSATTNDHSPILVDRLCALIEPDDSKQSTMLSSYVQYCKCCLTRFDMHQTLRILVSLNNCLEQALWHDLKVTVKNSHSSHLRSVITTIISENSVLINDNMNILGGIFLSKRKSDRSLSSTVGRSTLINILWDFIEELLHKSLLLLSEKDDNDSESQSLVVADHSEKSSFILVALHLISNYWIMVLGEGLDLCSENWLLRRELVHNILLSLIQVSSKQFFLLLSLSRFCSVVLVETLCDRPKAATVLQDAVESITCMNFLQLFLSTARQVDNSESNTILLTKSLALTAAVCSLVDSPSTFWAALEITKTFIFPCRRSVLQVSQNIVDHLAKLLRLAQVFKPFLPQVMDLVIFPILKNSRVAKKGLFVMVDKLFRFGNTSFLVHFGGLTLARLIMQGADDIQSILGTAASHHVEIPLPKEYLLDDLSHVLYHVLVSNSVFHSTISVVIKGTLLQWFSTSCRIFRVQLHDCCETEILSEKALNNLIIQLIWSLGSKGEVSDRALKGLKIICYLYFQGKWKGEIEDESNLENGLLIATSFVLSKCFLFIFSYLLQQNWNAQKCIYQIQSLSSLRKLISMLEPETIGKFFAKIWNTVDIALQSKVVEVKCKSIEVAEVLCEHLPKDILRENLLVIAAGLLSIFIERIPESIEISSIISTIADQLSNALPTPIEDVTPSIVLTELRESSSYLQNQENLSTIVKEKSIKLVYELLNSNNIDSTICGISLVIVGGAPNNVQFQALRTEHEEKIRCLSLDFLFGEIHSLLKHESSQVRTIALKVCLHILKTRKDDFYKLLNVSINNATVGVNESSISLLVKDLLELTTREIDPTALQHAGKCLGEMGSINPSLIQVDTIEMNKKFSPKNFPHPMSLTLSQFALHVLHIYIVMGFKGANSIAAQDQSSYAIQEILQILKKIQVIQHSQQIPEDIRKDLSSRGILDVVEPFWASKYKIKDVSIRYKTPLYRAGMEYARWIYLFCRYLISEVSGPLKAVFEACRGVVRYRVDLCQFFLPYLILEVATHASKNDVHTAVIDEIASVLSASLRKEDSGSNSGIDSFNHLCVQTIFNVLDIFEDWKASLMETQSSNSSDESYLVFDVFGTKTDVIAALQNVLSKISLCQLSEAAMVTKSFTRAMRYLEIEAREYHRAQGGKSTDRISPISGINSTFSIVSILKRGDDKAGGELPILREDQINSLATIYGELEDIDALSGVQILRRVNGYNESLKNKVVELTQSDDWLGALLEYELIQNSPLYVKSLSQSCSMRQHPGSGLKMFSSTPKRFCNNFIVDGNQCTRLLQRKDIVYRYPSLAHDYAVNVTNFNQSEGKFSLQEICDIEKGKLRCLIELGHLESVINQASGRSALSEDLQRALTPIGLEASWRLMKWDDANYFVEVAKSMQLENGTCLGDAEDFRLRIGKSLYFMNNGDTNAFREEVAEARRLAVMGLAAAGMESYGRAYPSLCRLHILHELESGFELLTISSSGLKRKSDHIVRDDQVDTVNSWHWNNRLKFMSDSMSHRSQLLAIRRAILGLLNMNNKVAENWLDLSNSLRHMGRYESARIALKNAVHCGTDEDVALIEDCRLLREQGQAQKALLLLEPSEIDLSAILSGLKVRRKASVPAFIDSEEKRITLAERIHLATQIMIELHQSQASYILDRYEAILALHKKWDQAYYDCGKYLEFLFSEAMERDVQQQQMPIVNPSSSIRSNTGQNNHTNNDTKSYYAYVEDAIDKYGHCLRLGGTTTLQVLPKILTLWFTYTELRTNNQSSSITPLQSSQSKVNDHMQKLAQDVGPHVWFSAVQQIVSRVGHKNPDTLAIIETLLLKVLTAYPKQGIWHIAHLMYSLNRDRREIAKKVLRETHRQIKDSRPTDGRMLVESQHLFQNLSNLAALNCNQRRISWQMDKKIQLDLFLIPTQSILLHCDLTMSQGTAHSVSSGFMYLHKFGDYIDVASSKAKPKTIRFETTCGKSLKFLCKQEKDGDLRKDMLLMVFNNTVNKLFQQDAQGGRQRNLRLRTYAVVCLNEECGILEWVNNTECLRHLIGQAHSYPNWSEMYPMLHVKDIYLLMKEYQEKYEDDLPMMIKCYKDLVDKYKPCFHKWFLERFKDATSWYEARLLYSRSTAVWSSVGHVIGLGDRHTENILIDVTNGECVHVDFDCLFDKGLTLLRPEIIPFRLTQNMVDAMGVCGVEGTYRRTLEISLKILRENKEILLNVLEPFLRDPTVAWSRSGRAQKSDQTSHSKQQIANEDQANSEATEMMKRIAARLSGEYYFFHPGREKIIRGAKSRNQPVPSKGVGPSRVELMPLSIPGQAQKLIDEATAIENLAQLYYGWQAWL